MWITRNCGKLLGRVTCLLRNVYAGEEETELDMVANWERSMSKLYIVTLFI